MSDLKVPKFESEAEEAEWWHANRGKVSAEFQEAAKEGRLGRGGGKAVAGRTRLPFREPGPTPTTTIRLDPEHSAEARKQAAERGLRYQAYLEMIIREALGKARQERAAP